MIARTNRSITLRLWDLQTWLVIVMVVGCGLAAGVGIIHRGYQVRQQQERQQQIRRQEQQRLDAIKSDQKKLDAFRY